MSAEVFDRRDTPFPTKVFRSGFFKITLEGDNRTNGQYVRFLNKFSEYFALQFVQCPFGGAAQVWSLPGDRGNRQANLGFFPLGGSVLIYIPVNYEIIVQQGEWVKSTETILANRKGSLE
ncbi:MAG: hypothetical protein H6622_01940 [Halobacteriovoraceae bacterium]|nr:hypothetical protein [Halobacteriovoraceae bacterium]